MLAVAQVSIRTVILNLNLSYLPEPLSLAPVTTGTTVAFTPHIFQLLVFFFLMLLAFGIAASITTAFFCCTPINMMSGLLAITSLLAWILKSQVGHSQPSEEVSSIQTMGLLARTQSRCSCSLSLPLSYGFSSVLFLSASYKACFFVLDCLRSIFAHPAPGVLSDVVNPCLYWSCMKRCSSAFIISASMQFFNPAVHLLEPFSDILQYFSCFLLHSISFSCPWPPKLRFVYCLDLEYEVLSNWEEIDWPNLNTARSLQNSHQTTDAHIFGARQCPVT